MHHLRRLIENTEQMPGLARGMLCEAARGPERLAAYATAEGYPISAQDIVTALHGGKQAHRHYNARHDVELDLAEHETDRVGGVPPGVWNPMLDLFRWYRQTIA